MKIAICTLSQNVRTPTGLLSWFAQLARALPVVDPDTDYRFIASEEVAAVLRRSAPQVRTEVVGWDSSHRVLRLLSEHFLLGYHLIRHDYDGLLMANAGTAPFFLPRPIRHVQAVYGLHQRAANDVRWGQKIYRNLLFGRTVRRADRLVVNSDYSRAQLENLAPGASGKISVVPHGYDGGLFHPGPPSEAELRALNDLRIGAPYFAFVSQIYLYKNVTTAVKGFCAFVRKTGLPHRFVIVGKFDEIWGAGEAYRQEVIAIARSEGLEDRLLFRDYLSVAGLRALYVGAEGYIQPSLAETFGRTSLEAMACGCPVVAAHAAATPEIVGDAGLYFEGLDWERAAECLVRLASEPDLRASCRALGLERAKCFSFLEESRQLATVMAGAGSAGHKPG